MAENENVDPIRTTAALEEAPEIGRRYIRDGGSMKDLRTDMSAAINAADGPIDLLLLASELVRMAALELKEAQDRTFNE